MDLTVLWPLGLYDDMLIVSWLVQCKLRGYMRPAERAELISLADRYGCVPVLAGGRNPVKFTNLSTGGALEVRADEGVLPDPPGSD